MMREFFERLKEEKTTYAERVNFCCDFLILNNDIMGALIAKGFYFETINGEDYDEEDDCYYDVYQYFIIDAQGADRFQRYTTEIIYYCEELDLYILGVTHCGTSWSGVPASWKESIED